MVDDGAQRVCEELRAYAPGYAYVTAVNRAGTGVVVTLRYASGVEMSATFPVEILEGWGPPPQFNRVLAIQVRNGDVLACSALGTSEAGPTRTAITLGQALSLAADGVHTTFVSAAVVKAA